MRNGGREVGENGRDVGDGGREVGEDGREVGENGREMGGGGEKWEGLRKGAERCERVRRKLGEAGEMCESKEKSGRGWRNV